MSNHAFISASSSIVQFWIEIQRTFIKVATTGIFYLHKNSKRTNPNSKSINVPSFSLYSMVEYSDLYVALIGFNVDETLTPLHLNNLWVYT